MWTENRSYLNMRISMKTINDLALEVTMSDIRRAILKTRGLKLDENAVLCTDKYIQVMVESGDGKGARGKSGSSSADEKFIAVQNLKRLLPAIAIKGYPEAQRAIISKDTKKNADGFEENKLLVEGYGLKLCMTTDGIDGTRTRSNSVMEMNKELGIEAARATIIAELAAVMGTQMDIDPRHMQLLADVMTYKGDVLGITRFGLAKMRDSVLQLASFEKTPDHLFDAAVKGKIDHIEGVSECIIMGQSMAVGTGAMKVVRRLGLDENDLRKKETLFNDIYDEINPPRKG